MATVGAPPLVVYPVSVFYDPNHNPLNIPCEGPKVIPLNLTFGNASIVVDLTSVFNNGSFTRLQMISIEEDNAQQIIVTAGSINYSATNKGSIHVLQPMLATNPAVLTITGPVGESTIIHLFNFCYPAALKN